MPLRAFLALLCPLSAMLATTARADDWNQLKSSICSIGDVNGDLVNDLLVASRDGILPEVVWVVSGKDSSLIRVLRGAEPGDGFGCAIANGGDLNGDGCSDVLVGAPGGHLEQVSEGYIDLVRVSTAYSRAFSGKDGTLLYELKTGWIVASAGDVDGDGTPDSIVGAPSACFRNRKYQPGSVHVHSGRNGSVLYRLSPAREAEYQDHFGTSILGLDDIDGDGCADFAIGSADQNGGRGPLGSDLLSLGRGCVSTYSGVNGRRIASVQGDRDCTYLGWSLARVADLDGDDVMDFAAGAIHRDARILSGSDLHTIQRLPSRGGYEIYDAFASSLDILGDVDFDCVPDWVVGANEDAVAFDEGYAWVVSGRTGRRIGEIFRSESEGADVCGVGDVDGDGVPDVAMAIESKWNSDMRCSTLRDETSDPIRRVRIVSGRTWKTVWEIDVVARPNGRPSARSVSRPSTSCARTGQRFPHCSASRFSRGWESDGSTTSINRSRCCDVST